MVRVHPDSCHCRVCKKKRKESRKEERRVIYGMNLFYIFVAIIISVI